MGSNTQLTVINREGENLADFNSWAKSGNWDKFTWTGPKRVKHGEAIRPVIIPPVDYSNPKEKVITTEIDCYITGSYTTTKGKIFSIRERYTIQVTYSNSTIIESMTRVRSLLIQKFQEENPNYDVTDVFIPELPPDMKRVPEPRYYYAGGRAWKFQTRMQEGKFLLSTSKEIYKNRAERIIAEYGLKRSEGRISRL